MDKTTKIAATIGRVPVTLNATDHTYKREIKIGSQYFTQLIHIWDVRNCQGRVLGTLIDQEGNTVDPWVDGAPNIEWTIALGMSPSAAGERVENAKVPPVLLTFPAPTWAEVRASGRCVILHMGDAHVYLITEVIPPCKVLRTTRDSLWEMAKITHERWAHNILGIEETRDGSCHLYILQKGMVMVRDDHPSVVRREPELMCSPFAPGVWGFESSLESHMY